MMQHVCMVSLYVSSNVHTGGLSFKAFTRIDEIYVACCVSLLRNTSRKATFSYVDCLRAMAQWLSIENRLGRPVSSRTHDSGNGSILSSHVGACVKPASTWGVSAAVREIRPYHGFAWNQGLRGENHFSDG